MSFSEPAESFLPRKGAPSNRNMWIAAFSNLSTSFNLVNINLAHVILANEYCATDKGCATAVSAASTACLAGAIFGQLTFGYVGDCLGRGMAMRLTMLLSICGAFASAFAVPLTSSDETSVFSFLLITRLILGIGVGGVYPLAATVAAESASEGKRGRSVALVFSMQGIGNVLVPVVGLVVLKIFGTPDFPTINGMPGMSWRVLLGIGALPGLLLAPFKTTPSAVPIVQPAAAPAQVSMWQALRSPRYLRKLLGTAGGWFILDITFFGNTLFAPTVLKQIFHNVGETPLNGPTVKDNLCLQLLIIALIGLPGYYVSVFFMDKLGRKLIQLQGFFFMAVLYGILAIWLDELSSGLLIVIYGLTFFFSNFGPNCTTFILPSETFPQEVRSTFNGLSAACGKAGAVVGSAAFAPLAESYGNGAAMAACAVCSVFGFFLTMFFVEDRRGKGMAGNSIMVTKEAMAEDA